MAIPLKQVSDVLYGTLDSRTLYSYTKGTLLLAAYPADLEELIRGVHLPAPLLLHHAEKTYRIPEVERIGLYPGDPFMTANNSTLRLDEGVIAEEHALWRALDRSFKKANF